MPIPNALPPQPYPRRAPVRLRRRVLTLTGLGLAGLLAGLLSGCASVTTVSNPAPSALAYAQLAGNWRFTTANASTPQLTLGGSLAVNGSAVSGMLHALTPGQCLAPTDTIPVKGAIDPAGALTLSGASPGGTVLHITGTAAADRHSLDNPTLTATGGACAGPGQAIAQDSSGGATAQQYQPVSGTYTGTLITAEGESFPLTTTVTQLDQPDASGIYHLQGSAAASTNPCLPPSVTATASTLSGGVLSATYTDSSGATSITATGSASPDGRTLTLSNWSLTSTCGSDTGAGILLQQ